VAEADDERSFPALPLWQYVTHDPPVRLRDGVASPARRNPPDEPAPLETLARG